MADPIGEIGRIGSGAFPVQGAAAGGLNAALPAAGQSVGGINQKDNVNLSQELNDEQKKTQDPSQLDPEKQEKLKEIERQIQELEKKLQEALAANNLAEALPLMNQINELQKMKDALLGGGQSPQLTPESMGIPSGGGGTPAGGGGAPSGGIPSGGGAPSGGGEPSGGGAPVGRDRAPSGSGEVTPPETSPSAPINLEGNDKKTADFINQYLQQQGSPAAGKQAGEMMVKYGKQYGVDPLALLSIAGHETQFGKKGVGVNGMLGVGAYDSNPRNSTRNPKFSGIENQIRVGAKTFANLRAKGGSSANDSLSRQFSAANRAGWATDRNWHNGVGRMYNKISSSAKKYK
jgi:hypothetical protein